MKLNIDDLTGKARRYSLKSDDLIPISDEIDQLSAAIEIAICRRDDDNFAISGEFKASRSVACDRCGEVVEQTLMRNFFYLATTRKEEIVDLPEVEVREDDVDTLFLQEPIIDLGEILQEQAYLAMPLKTLCKDNCKGICPECGVVLNRFVCSCTPDRKESPFAALRKLSIH